MARDDELLEALRALPPRVLALARARVKAALAAEEGGDGGDAAGPIARLLEAKRRSDRRDYRGKHAILRELLRRYPDRFVVDSSGPGPMLGLTYDPRGAHFRLHAPRALVPPGVPRWTTPSATAPRPRPGPTPTER